MSRVLVIDDDSDILRYCDTMLSKQGHEVVTSTSSEDALETLRTHSVDLVISDIVMPNKMSGFDFIRYAKRIPNFESPILMLSGKTSAQDVIKALELGAVDYVCKPLDKDVFLAKVGMLLNRVEPQEEISFAQGTTFTKAEITLGVTIVRVSEMGLSLRSQTYFDRGVRLQIQSPLFKEIGIPVTPLRVAISYAVENDRDHKYESFLSFIGLDEPSMKKIRKWVTSKALSYRKVQ